MLLSVQSRHYKNRYFSLSFTVCLTVLSLVVWKVFQLNWNSCAFVLCRWKYNEAWLWPSRPSIHEDWQGSDVHRDFHDCERFLCCASNRPANPEVYPWRLEHNKIAWPRREDQEITCTGTTTWWLWRFLSRIYWTTRIYWTRRRRQWIVHGWLDDISYQSFNYDLSHLTLPQARIKK